MWDERVHFQLECRGISRSDFIYDEAWGGEGLSFLEIRGMFFLEINTQPGMTATSLAPEQAKFCKMSFPELIARLIDFAALDAK